MFAEIFYQDMESCSFESLSSRIYRHFMAREEGELDATATSGVHFTPK